jgi:hypothetical protein
MQKLTRIQKKQANPQIGLVIKSTANTHSTLYGTTADQQSQRKPPSILRKSPSPLQSQKAQFSQIWCARTRALGLFCSEILPTQGKKCFFVGEMYAV